MDKRIETTYDPVKKQTLIILWERMQILDSETIDGEITEEQLSEIEANAKKHDMIYHA